MMISTGRTVGECRSWFGLGRSVVGAATLPVTASVGVSALELSGDTPELLLKRADQALYCAKRDGRNRVVADAARVRSWLVETRRIRPDS